MKVITNNETLAIEVLSAQNLFNVDIDEITIRGLGSQKYCLNNYDAEITIKGNKFILMRDLNFQNVNIKDVLSADICDIEFILLTD